MTLKEKVLKIIELQGFMSSYAENMLYAIEQYESKHPDYFLLDNSVQHRLRLPIRWPHEVEWTFEHLVGEYVLSKDLIKEFNEQQ